MGIETLIGASIGGQLLGGIMGADAAQGAADTQAAAANAASQNTLTASRESNALQKQIYDENVARQAPFLQTGVAANSKLAQLMGLNMPSSGSMPYNPGLFQAVQQGMAGGYPAQNSPQPQSFTTTLPDWLTRRVGSDPKSWDPALVEAYGIKTPVVSQGNQYQNNQGMLSNLFAQTVQGQGSPQDQTGFGDLAKRFSLSDFQQDPGYAFRMQEGQKAIDNSASARGMSLSGAALKALQKYGQDFASNEYQKSYDRFNNDNTMLYNRYAGLAGSGQTATGAINSAASNYGNAVNANNMNASGIVGNNMIGAGNAQAAGQVGSANAWSNGIGGAINNYQSNQLMNMFSKPTTPTNSYDAGAFWAL